MQVQRLWYIMSEEENITDTTSFLRGKIDTIEREQVTMKEQLGNIEVQNGKIETTLLQLEKANESMEQTVVDAMEQTTTNFTTIIENRDQKLRIAEAKREVDVAKAKEAIAEEEAEILRTEKAERKTRLLFWLKYFAPVVMIVCIGIFTYAGNQYLEMREDAKKADQLQTIEMMKALLEKKHTQ